MEKNSLKLYYNSLKLNLKSHQCNGNLFELLTLQHPILNHTTEDDSFVAQYPILKAVTEGRLTVRETNLSNSMVEISKQISSAILNVPSLSPTLYAFTYSVYDMRNPNLEERHKDINLSIVLNKYIDVFNDLIDISLIVQKLYRFGAEEHPCTGYLNPKTRDVYILVPRYQGNNLTKILGISHTVLLYMTFQKILTNTTESDANLIYAAPTTEYLKNMDEVRERFKLLNAIGSKELFQPDYLDAYKNFNQTIWEANLYNTTWEMDIFMYLLENVRTNMKSESTRELQETERRYADIYAQLQELSARKTDLERRLLAPQAGSERLTRFMNALLQAQNENFKILIYYVKENKTTIKLSITEPIHFDSAFLTMPIINKNLFTRIFFNKLARDDIRAYFRQTIQIEINQRNQIFVSSVDNVDEGHYHSREEYGIFPNTHHTRYNCFGTYHHEFTRCYDNETFDVLFAYFKDSVANINIADGAVFPKFVGYVVERQEFKVYSTILDSYITLKELYEGKDVIIEEPTPVVEEQPVPEDPLDVEDQPDEEGVFTEALHFTPVFPMREMHLEQADIEAVAETMRARLDTGIIDPHNIAMNEALNHLQMRRYNPVGTAEQPRFPTLDEVRATATAMRDHLTPVQPYTTIVTPEQMPMTPEEAEAEEIRQAEELGVL